MYGGVTVKNTQGVTPQNATLRADEYCILARCDILKGRNFFKRVFYLSHLSYLLSDSENCETGCDRFELTEKNKILLITFWGVTGVCHP